MQTGQITNMLNIKQSGTLPSDTERNPREHMKAIMLRSGKELSDLITKKKNNEEKKVVEEKQRIKVHKPKEDKVTRGRISFPNNPPSYVPPVPCPQRPVKTKLDK